MKIHVAESSAYKSLLSKLRESKSAGERSSENVARQRAMQTIGSAPAAQKQPRSDYSELSDSDLLESRQTIEGGELMAMQAGGNGTSGAKNAMTDVYQLQHQHQHRTHPLDRHV